MTKDIIARATASIRQIRLTDPLGRVQGVGGSMVTASGLAAQAHIGDRIELSGRDGPVRGEVLRIDHQEIDILPEGPTEGISIGSPVRLLPPPRFTPHSGWIGRIVDPDGHPLDGKPLTMGHDNRKLRGLPPAPETRKRIGARLPTGLAVFDTLLPLAQGQRLGLFAGSGVGKSTLMGELAQTVTADVIVIALVGERGRELREFCEKSLGPEGMKRSVIVTATSDRAPQIRRRCAWAAMAVAEMFRDQGKQVLLMIDSITRFAEAHRELAVAGGEPASLRGYPPSTGPAIANLCERAGPGPEGAGDITAVFTVLVAGSDMEEPVADILRGVLDGHVVLDRAIAERGRFPAVDLLRSVSRSLPDVATDSENTLISEARSQLGTYDKSEMMIQAGLYTSGSDPRIDAAIQVHPALEQFLALREPRGVDASFSALRIALSADAPR